MAYQWWDIRGYEIGIGCGDIVIPDNTVIDENLLDALKIARQLQPQVISQLNQAPLDYDPPKLTEPEKKRRRFKKKRKKFYVKLAAQFGEVCVVCGDTDDLCVDHIIPISKGGESVLENLQLLCRSCNSSKGSKSMEEWSVTNGNICT